MTNDDNNKLSILDFDELYQVCWLIDGVSGALDLGTHNDSDGQPCQRVSMLLDHISRTLEARLDVLKNKALTV